jgi:ADP-ribose pyrophosphatase
MFKLKKRHIIYSDEWVKFFKDEIQFPDGTEGTYSWVNRRNGVGVVVITTDNKILLNKEFRYVIRTSSWELPGGGIDEGEDPAEAAKRELYEETGIKVEKVKKLGFFYPLHSFNTESVTLFTTEIDPQSVTTDESEGHEQVDEQKFFSFAEALEMIDNGEIIDALTANAIQMVIRQKA